MFKKIFKNNDIEKILSPLSGKAISISRVTDPTFSEKILGDGVAIEPSSNRVVSPIDGDVTQMFDTGHAVSLTGEKGLELLIHVGLDTVKLKGRHYKKLVENGDKVHAGDLLLEFDREAIAAEGYDVTTPIVILNSQDYKSMDIRTDVEVEEQDELISLRK